MQIDFTYLETVSDGDNDFIIQFIQTFDETIDTLSKKMQLEFSSGDFDNLGKSAHQLKPSAKMLGLESGDQLEKIQDNPSTASDELLKSIHDNCQSGSRELKKWAKEKGIDV